MVHTFVFEYEGQPSYYIWDIESGSLHNVDLAAFLLCKKLYGTLSAEEEKQLSLFDDAELKDIEAELKELEAQGLLNAPERRVELHPNCEVKAMCLHICHDCNLKCSYCFAKEGTYNTERDYMSFDVGKAAIDFLVEKSGKRQNLEVDFFGGEPLMNFDVVKRIVAYGREAAAAAGKKISYTMTTNGVLLNDDAIEYLNREMDNVVISIDGRQEVHDALRKTRNDKGSYAIALANAKKFRAVRGDKRYYIRGTFTANNPDFCADVLHLNDCGFDQISVEPVVLPASSPFALTEKHIPQLLSEYDKLANAYLERRKGDKWFNFFHFMLDLDNGPCLNKRLMGCGAGCEYVAVTPIGDIYPCHQFVGSGYPMGSVLTGKFDRSVQKTFSELTVYSKPKCENCFAKYYCSGGCAANALHFGGALTEPYELSCALMRKRFEVSLAIYAIEKAQK